VKVRIEEKIMIMSHFLLDEYKFNVFGVAIGMIHLKIFLDKSMVNINVLYNE
jgi:hypothetical protein